MKKVLKLIVLFISVVVVSGCKKEVITKCELTNDQSNSGYIIQSTYEIYSNGNIVKKVNTKEEVTSKNNTILAYFEKELKDQYKNYSETYGGYTYEVKISNDKVISNVTIDYSKMSLDKFIKDNASMQSYVDKNNNLTLSGVKKMYESIGATCK